MTKVYTDFVDKPVRNNEDQLLLNQKAEKEHYENLLWNLEDQSEKTHVENRNESNTKAICNIASGKAAGPSGTITKILKSLGKTGTPKVPDLVDITTDSCIPSDWH